MNSPEPLQRFRIFLESLVRIPSDQWSHIESRLHVRRYEEGEILLRQGEAAAKIFFVCQGLLKTTILEKSGSQYTKGFVWENGLAAPYVAILTARPANLGILALEQSQVLEIPAELIPKLYQNHMCWQELGRKIAEALLVERERREYQFVAWNATERYEAFTREYPELLRRVPLYEIASYLGITPVALSKIRAKKASKSRKITIS
jgi:CRP-like cAMP-binding protein